MAIDQSSAPVMPMRREFMRFGAAGLMTASWPVAAALPSRPEPAIDLLIRGGTVLDPASATQAPADVAVRAGRIVAIGPSLVPDGARKVHDASGMLVCPGLVDAHVHVADGMMPVSMLADDAGLMSGVTTVVDAGSLGARTLPAFRKYIWPQARTRVRALLNLSAAGLVVLNELYLDDKLISRSRALRAIDENRDLIVGIKARVRGTAASLDVDLKLMAQLREIADETGLPAMMHWTNEARLVDMLRPGDCMTHPFNPAYLGPNCIDEQGRVRPLTRELAQRGIMVDLGHGSSFDWKLAEAAAAQGWYPDVLSTDMFSRYFRPDGVVGDMGSLLSKFLLLGLDTAQVVQRATVAPVRMLGLPDELGRLVVGGVADITVLEARQGRFDFIDSPRLKQVRAGSVKLVATAVVKDGALFELKA